MAPRLRFGWLAVLASLLAVTSSVAVGQGLSLHPGLTVNFTVYDGLNASGQPLGDYDFVNEVTAAGAGGYQYAFRMTGPAAAAGQQAVSAADAKAGIMVREFWPAGDMTAAGYVSYLAVSAATFADLKVGRETPLHFDAGDDPVTLRPVGAEDLSTLIDETPTLVHTLKVKGGAGGTFWILDDPGLPMIVQGETRWKWRATAISDAGTAGSQVVSELKQTGEATTHSILFAFNSAELDPEALPVLTNLAAYLRANPKLAIEVGGYTDNIGGEAFNLTLSRSRAEAVKAYLVAAGIDVARLSAKGFGLSGPIADNALPEGRALNRRVVFRRL